MFEPRSGFFDSNDVKLHYLDWGGSGAPIVVLHATGFLGRAYRMIAEPLTKIGHVFSVDQRGHGDSDKRESLSYGWDDNVRDLAAFIEMQGLGAVRAFGHSAGATAIGSLAYERPELISKAVLAEPVLFEFPEGPELGWRNPFVERTLKRRRVFDSVDAMFANFESKPPYDGWRKDVLRDYCEYGTFQRSDGKRELKCPPEIEARYYDRVREFDGLGRILKCETPLLVLLGARGDSLGAFFADRLSRELKNGKVINFQKAGHFLPMEFPDEVTRLTIDFFSS